MIIKNKKIYVICLITCIVTMIAGFLLNETIFGALYGISFVLGILLGSLRVYVDFIKWVFRKKQTTIIPCSFYAISMLLMIKCIWYIFALGFGLMFALMLPAVFAVIAYFRYKNELIES